MSSLMQTRILLCSYVYIHYIHSLLGGCSLYHDRGDTLPSQDGAAD